MTVRKVSVVTVCLNTKDCIRLTLESVARQTFADVEHVIIDGGSTDGTQDIIREYNSVGYFISEKDSGVYDAMDKGTRAASGDVLIFLNAGDTFYDDSVCRDIVNFFDMTHADIVFGNLMPIYLKPSDTHDHGAFIAGKLLDIGYMLNRRQLFDESIHHQATFYRSWIFKSCTYYFEKYPPASGEYNLLLNAVMKKGARVKHIPRPVSRFVLGGISTRDFSKEWGKYVQARDELRATYCPTKNKIKVADQNEFHYIKKAPTKFPTKHGIKLFIKRSFAFRIYERLALGLQARLINGLTPRIIEALELQTHQLKNDLTPRITEALELQAHQLKNQFRDILEHGILAQLGEISEHQRLHQNDVFEETMKIVDAIKQMEAHAIESTGAHHLFLARSLQDIRRSHANSDLNIARILMSSIQDRDFEDYGFKVYSQWNEDGLIQYLVESLEISRRTFVEIGTGDYTEANTRLLLEKDNWSGLIIDSSSRNIELVRAQEIYWRHSLNAVSAFVTRENINELLSQNGVSGEIGLLSIDIDGVDYWVWEAITGISPQIVVCEYNGIFGSTANVTVPYAPDFDRTRKHYSWLYAGASLAALISLGSAKGYTLVGTNSGGNNAFFVRNDILALKQFTRSKKLYTRPMFREARNTDGSLSYLDISEGIKLIQDLDVYDVEQNQVVKIKGIPLAY